MNDHLDDVQLIGYVEHTLTDAERERLDRHLAQCPACRARLADREAFRRRAYHGLREGLARVRSSSRIAFESVAPRLRRNRRLEMLRTRTRWLASAAVLAAVILAVILAWSTLGPGREEKQPSVEPTPTPAIKREPVTISFACQDYQRSWYQGLARAFQEEHPEIAVEIVSKEEILDQQETYRTVSRTTQSTGDGQALVTSNVVVTKTQSQDDLLNLARRADTFVEFAGMLGDRPQDAVLDLTDLAAGDDAAILDDFFPAALALLERDGKVWGLPFDIGTLFIYYNPAMFDEAGVPYPEIGWTWDDLLDAASRLTVREEDKVVRYGFVDVWYRYTLLTLAHQRAEPLMTADYGIPQARLDTPELASAIRWYVDLVSTYEVAPNPVTTDDIVLQMMPYDQPSAMWSGLSIEWDNFQHRYEAGVVPYPADGQGAAPVNTYAYFVSAGTAHPEAAWRWIEWLTRQPPYRYTSGVPARRSVIEETGYWEQMDESLAAAFLYNIEHAVNYADPVRHGLRRAIEAVLEGTAVETALSEAQTLANEAFARIAADAERPVKEFVVTGPEPTLAPGGTPIRFNVLYSGDMEVYRPLVEQFHREHPEIHVDLVRGSDWRHDVQAGEADCFMGYAYIAREMTDDLLPLDPLLVADPAFDVEVFYLAFLERAQVDGTLWGLPLDSDALLLYYNRDRFDEAGRPYPAIDWMPQDLVDAALALADPGDTPPAYGFYPQDGALVDGATYVAWLGGRLFDAAGYPTFDDPSVVEALTVYADLVSRASPPEALEREGDRLSGVTVSSTTGSHPGWVRSGSVAMWTDTYGRYTSAPPLSYVGVAPLPKGAASFFATSSALFISRKTAYPEACWSWIAFLSAQPEAVRDLPVRRDVVKGDTWRAEVGAETADAWLAIVERGDALQPPWVSQASYAGSGALYWLDVALEDVLAGALPLEALTEAQVKAAAFVDCIGEGDYQETWRACAQQADPDVVLSEE